MSVCLGGRGEKRDSRSSLTPQPSQVQVLSRSGCPIPSHVPYYRDFLSTFFETNATISSILVTGQLLWQQGVRLD